MTGPPPPIGFIHNYMQSGQPTGFELSYGFPMPQTIEQPSSPPQPSSSSSSSSSDEEKETLQPTIVSQSTTVQDELVGGCWQHCTLEGPFPANMVRAGVDSDGATIFAGRAFHEGEMIPAKVIPSKNLAFICYGGEEVLKEDFEVLRSGDFVWEFAANGVIPDGAVKIGATIDGEPLYMGRALHSGTQTPGKVHSSHGCLYIPFDGAEISYCEYEVLCLK
ncbi:uncharacterized protein LOC129771994 [Toxorhynchites rutilus septentrionalis]|uniref:uncharacterized protein LOC129771994 n=1 Tax=Toxorhynchites rutilus septentrionalis TaxID=329112 RepID=UPI0024793BAE|nr:uncharacterized protein LOC129771994 [Toxorhynchites rutilus septentrionalis]